MIGNKQKGFALVLSLVLLLAMSLMGGALIVISAGGHQSNNTSDEYQQTFYVAETALIEGEKYLLNQYLGPWNTSNHTRDTAKRKLPANGASNWSGTIVNSNRKNYTTNSSFYYDTSNYCYNSFKDIDIRHKVPHISLFLIVLGLSFISFDPPKVLLSFFILYALSGPILLIIRILKKKNIRSEKKPTGT